VQSRIFLYCCYLLGGSICWFRVNKIENSCLTLLFG